VPHSHAPKTLQVAILVRRTGYAGRASLLEKTDLGGLPRHVAVIMDGQRAVGAERHLPRIAGAPFGDAIGPHDTRNCAPWKIEAADALCFSVENLAAAEDGDRLPDGAPSRIHPQEVRRPSEENEIGYCSSDSKRHLPWRSGTSAKERHQEVDLRLRPPASSRPKRLKASAASILGGASSLSCGPIASPNGPRNPRKVPLLPPTGRCRP